MSPEVEEQDPNEEDDDNGKLKAEHYEPAEDVYSMIFVSPIFSTSFIYSIAIFSIQLLILILFIVNLLKDSMEGNLFVVPVMTGVEVQIGQLIALIVTVMTADDVTRSLDVFHVHYDQDIEKHFPHASRKKWYLTRLMRSSEGLLVVVVSFIFIVQSSANLDLFLNFAAVTFVGDLDNIAFDIADHGYSLFDLKRVTDEIKDKLTFKNQPVPSAKRHRIQNRTIIVLLLALFAGWITVILQQLGGEFYDSVCQTFDIKFDDFSYDFFSHVCPELSSGSSACPKSWLDRGGKLRYPSFSDVYYAQRAENGKLILHNKRPVYYQRGISGFNAFGEESPPGKISYCAEERAWMFSIEGVSKGKVDLSDSSDCNWLMKSTETDEYRLDKVSTQGWVVWTEILEPSTKFQITCIECDDSVNVQMPSELSNVGCTYHGYCSNQDCVCEENWMGTQCQTCSACSQLTVLDIETNENLTFWRLDEDDTIHGTGTTPTHVYGRPVYYFGKKVNGTIETGEEIAFLVYTGAAFAVYDFRGIGSSNNTESLEKLKTFLNTYHSTWDLTNKTKPIYTSELTGSHYPFNLKWTNETTGQMQEIPIWCPEEDMMVCPFAFE